MIVRAYKIYALPIAQKSQHELELVGQIDVIVLCEIDEFRISLRKQDIHLLGKGRLIANPIEVNVDKIFRCEVTFEKSAIFLRAPVENGPNLYSKRAK